VKTIILDKIGYFSYADTPEPGEALIAVRRISICGTDLHAYEGTQPFSTTCASSAMNSASRW